LQTQDEPISCPAVIAWEAFADGAEAVEADERDTADPDQYVKLKTICVEFNCLLIMLEL
jgi:hypothetical protein